MSQAQEGNTVTVHYTGRLEEDGAVFDTSREGEPLQVHIGSEQVIPGFERALVGMEPGETKTVTLEPGEAYGERQDDLVFGLDRDQVPEEPEQGQQLQLRHPSGTLIPVTVVGVDEDQVMVDANHILAGKTLVFEIELVEILEEAAGNEAEA